MNFENEIVVVDGRGPSARGGEGTQKVFQKIRSIKVSSLSHTTPYFTLLVDALIDFEKFEVISTHSTFFTKGTIKSLKKRKGKVEIR